MRVCVKCEGVCRLAIWEQRKSVGKCDVLPTASLCLNGTLPRTPHRTLTPCELFIVTPANLLIACFCCYSYKERHQAEFFGRGNLAGIDIRVQKKNKSQFYQELLEERRTDDQKKQAEWVWFNLVAI